jgi:hypothetical protein
MMMMMMMMMIFDLHKDRQTAIHTYYIKCIFLIKI